MNLYCASCGLKGSKKTMTVSRATGNAYCFNMVECRERAARRAVQMAPSFHTQKGSSNA